MPQSVPAVRRSAKPNIKPAEWEQRVNLAACYRLVEHFGWTDLIYTHISARVLEPVQSAIRLRSAGAGDGGQCRAQPAAAGRRRAHGQARGRAGGAVRHGMAGASAQARPDGSIVPAVMLALPRS